MTVRFFDGFESVGSLGDFGSSFQTQLELRWTAADVTYGTDSKLAGGRTGGLCLSWENDSGKFVKKHFDSNPNGTWIVGFGHKVPTANQGNRILEVRASEDTTHLAIGIDWMNRLYIERGTELLETSDLTVQPDRWYYIEFKFTIHDTTGSYELRLNGNSLLSDTNVDTRYGSAPASVSRFVFVAQDAGGCLDDVYILDGDSPDNDFLGAVVVESLVPTSDDTVQWSPSAGTDNYALVDEIPCNFGTDYVYDDTSGDTDLYGYEDLSTIDAAVVAVLVFSVAALSDSTSMDFQNVCKSGTTQEASSAYTVSQTDPAYKSFEWVLAQTPDLSDWTVVLVDGALFGVQMV